MVHGGELADVLQRRAATSIRSWPGSERTRATDFTVALTEPTPCLRLDLGYQTSLSHTPTQERDFPARERREQRLRSDVN